MKSRRNRPEIRSLRSRAGRAGSVRETQFEALEQRKLLFSISITPDMDADGDGLGTASAQWAYTMPYLDSATEPQEDTEPEEVTDDFNDEPTGPVANRSFLADSNIRVSHSFGFSQNFRIDPPGEDINERYLQINAVDGSFWMFEPMLVDEESGDEYNLSATQVSFAISDPEGEGGDGQGLLPNGFVVDLMFFDEVIDSFTGNELMAANQSGSAQDRQRGIGTFIFDVSDANAAAFTAVRIRGGTAEDMRLDDLAFLVPQGVFADIVDGRIWGAEFSFTAPIGASVQVLDLYGRDMVRTIGLGKPDQMQLTLVDLDDDGVPNFNDGIGQVRFSGVDSRATFTMFGGTVEWDDTGFLYTRVDNFLGFYEDFEEGETGFGYLVEYDDSGTPTVYGVPAGPGSLVFGAPDAMVRDNANSNTYDPAGLVPTGSLVGVTDGFYIPDGFARADQGVFVTNGESMGSVYIHGVMHGSSRFSGAVNELYFGSLVGTVTVEGDLGTMYVGADAGDWISDDDAINEVLVNTASELIVGRTLGEVAVGGRSDLNVTVVGDLTNPALRPPDDSYRYFEREKIYQLPLDAPDPEITIINNILFPADDFFRDAASLFPFSAGRSPLFVSSTLRNDTIMGAEFVGSISSAVQVGGALGWGDPINGEDGADIYGFAVDGTQTVVIQINTLGPEGLVRVFDQNGRPVASDEFQIVPSDPSVLSVSQTFQFRPAHQGVYYVEVSDVGVDLVDGDGETGWEYVLTLAGLAPVTLGSYRTAGSSGHIQIPTIQTITGSIGALRVGVCFTGPDGTDQSPIEIMNRPGDEEEEDAIDMNGSSFSAAGNLYALVAGSDIRLGDLYVEGDMGGMYVGMSPVVALTGDGRNGDVYGFRMQVGGRIADIDIKGAVGIDQDPADPLEFILGIGADIRTGLSGGDGSIGMIRIGGDVNGGTLTISTSEGSTVGGLMVSQDRTDDFSDQIGFFNDTFLGSDVNLGFGSDLRFADFPRIDILNNADHFVELFVGEPVEFTDDGGGIVRIEVQGAIPGLLAGAVRILPIDSGQGVAIARIDGVNGAGLDLTGGRSLRISGVGRVGGSGNAPISIGRIDVAAADATSNIVIDGDVEVDVWRITSAVAINQISNETPGGDIVAIDVAGLTTLEILDGDLGRTQTTAFGPQNVGPFLGIALGEQTAVGGPVGVPQESLAPVPLQGTFRPAGTVGNDAYLDDIGSPLDLYLNGLVVRGGNVQLVSVGGGIGDVILQGGGTLQNLVADADFLASGDGIDGIFGTIYAQIIDRVDVGQGLVATTRAPFAGSGIFASDEIRNILADGLLHPGAFIGGIIIARDQFATPRPDGSPEVGGIGQITVSSGEIRGAYIGSMRLDAFLNGYANDGSVYAGTIDAIDGTDLTIFRSEIEAAFLNEMTLTNGVYDATVMSIGRDLGDMSVETIRNSTLIGGEFEFSYNRITVGRDIDSITAGDVSDLRLEGLGRVTGTIASETWRRVEFQLNGDVPSIAITGALVASRLSVGELDSLTADAIRTTQVLVSGALTSVAAVTEIYNSEFSVTGPSGEIGTITAPNRITGSISASGPITSVAATAGDLIASVRTTTSRGTVGSLSAGRDLILETDISMGVGSLVAGRHLGRPEYTGLIFVRGDLASLTAGGHIFTDVRVGGVLTSATIGAVANRPGAVMGHSGSLYGASGVGTVSIAGDYGGHIVAYTGNVASVAITNGSLLSTGSVRAYDSDVQSVVITNGNLYGDIYADWDVVDVSVVAGADGVFGDIGVNPALSAGVSYDSLRGQLPPGTAPTSGQDGPSISAGHNVTRVAVTGGSMFETTIFAARSISSVQVNGHVMSDSTPQNTGRNVFAAGGSVASITVAQSMQQAQILAGVRSLGDDMLPGGFGDDADVTNAGSVGTVVVGGDMLNTAITAGMRAGSDRVYNTADDLLEIGYSSVGAVSVGGAGTGSTVFTDTLLPGSTAGGKLVGGGSNRPVASEDIAVATTGTAIPKGAPFAFSTSAGTGSITFAGAGSAFFDSATSRVILTGTDLTTTLVVRGTGSGVLTGFDIVSTEGASVGLVRVQARLEGDSDIVIDEVINNLQMGHYRGEGLIQAGDTLNIFTSGDFSGGTIAAGVANSVVVSGDHGDPDEDVRGEAMMSFITAGDIRITGDMRGAISSQRGINSVTVDGALDNGLIHAGGGFGAITLGSATESRISAGDTLSTLTVAGDFHDTSVMIGGDLGDDAEIGGEGLDADAVSAGFIGTVTIGGDFVISDIVAGYTRGPDGFFGTSDDLLASGRSSIGSVTIGGEVLGSNRESESYRIASTGSLGPVTAGGAPAENDRNLLIVSERLDPLPIQIEDIAVTRAGRVVTATLTLNQHVDFSSIARALSVSEVRGLGDVEIRLIEGVDYTTSYQTASRSIVVTFSTTVTERNLPQLTDQPGPGVYRFEILSEEIRARGVLAQLDGDHDGRIAASDDFSMDNIVGDAGDAFTPRVFSIPAQNGFPEGQVDLYGPINLDVLLDNNLHSDGLPDANVEYTVRGAIGDHPDNNPDYFSFASDADLYSITLQAGQILRLGVMQGPAEFTDRGVIQPDGNFLAGSTEYGLSLPFEPVTSDNRELNFSQDYLIRRTGTYYIFVGNVFAADLGILPDIDPVPGGVGTYNFTLNIFDDGDTGFNAPTNAGDGQDLVNAPAPSAFAGNDGVLGTADDPASIVNGPYIFVYNAGADTIPGTADDFVSGGNGSNVTSVTNALGSKMVSVNAAIGTPGAAGLPSDFFPDIDVFHLNGGVPIAKGTVVRATLKLAELGSDLGSRVGSLLDPFVLSQYVKFAVFDTSTATGSDDALLVFSPSDVMPTSGEPGSIAESDGVSYGYDASGNFYLEFVAPGRMDVPGAAASYAIYVQGVLNTDYSLEIVASGSRSLVRRTQNILVEANGGSVEWLEVGGVTTPVGPFVASSLGFTGTAENGQPIDEYIIDRVLETMQDAFDSIVTGPGSDGVFGTADDERGLDINVSDDPNDFEFQDYSTIFLSSSVDPVNPLFTIDSLGFINFLTGSGEIGRQDFGVSEHVDAGNADRNDESVLFMPTYSILGYTPSSADLEAFIQSLSAGAARRAGELLGLRITEEYDPTEDLFDVMAANSVSDVPGEAGSYEFPWLDRRLSTPFDSSRDSDFFLGYQNAAGLLSLYTREA